ncbi:MAG: hypothetical protein ACE5E1_03155 [Phycisphaerae bacterium]
MDETGTQQNMLQLGLIGIFFDFVTLFMNFVTGVIVPNVVTPLISGLLSLFTLNPNPPV